MANKEFSQVRCSLGKTQGGLARLLCVSPKAIQSFEFLAWSYLILSPGRSIVLRTKTHSSPWQVVPVDKVMLTD